MLLAVLSLPTRLSASYPEVIHVNGDRFHVQGIAFDQKKSCLYCSFTSTFLKTDLQGNIIGSITGINGHLGAMTFNPKTRKVYASLEIKNDAIGRNISDGLGVKRHEESQSGFYIAEIDVDKILSTIKSRYSNEKVNDIDGVKIDFAENWVHLRKSNTEPIIRIYTEAKSMAEAESLAKRFISEIEQICKA